MTGGVHPVIMKYEWNPEKNEWLKNEKNISFEQNLQNELDM